MQDSRIKITKGQSGEVTVTLPYNPVHIEKLKEIEGHKWNPEQKCWTFPRSNDTIKNLLAIFRDKDVWVEPSLEQEVVGDLFENLRRELVSRKYSPKTIKAYIHYNVDLLKFSGKGVKDIAEMDIKNYLFYLVEEKKVATSTLNSAINALKFYYGTVFKKKLYLRNQASSKR